jgi:hypothetical protein
VAGEVLKLMTALTFIEYGEFVINVLSVEVPTTKFPAEIENMGIVVIAALLLQTKLYVTVQYDGVGLKLPIALLLAVALVIIYERESDERLFASVAD